VVTGSFRASRNQVSRVNPNHQSHPEWSFILPRDAIVCICRTVNAFLSGVVMLIWMSLDLVVDLLWPKKKWSKGKTWVKLGMISIAAVFVIWGSILEHADQMENTRALSNQTAIATQSLAKMETLQKGLEGAQRRQEELSRFLERISTNSNANPAVLPLVIEARKKRDEISSELFDLHTLAAEDENRRETRRLEEEEDRRMASEANKEIWQRKTENLRPVYNSAIELLTNDLKQVALELRAQVVSNLQPLPSVVVSNCGLGEIEIPGSVYTFNVEVRINNSWISFVIQYSDRNDWVWYSHSGRRAYTAL
jgi:hypothetical protein